MESTITCPKCDRTLDVVEAPEQTVSCYCTRKSHVHIYPAFYRKETAAQAERVMVEGESSCFYHEDKKAVEPCAGCGRFLCSICAVDLGTETICLQCLSNRKEKQTDPGLEAKRMLWDDMALSVSLLATLLSVSIIPLFSIPSVIYLVAKNWKNGSTSIIPRTRWRYVFALLLLPIQAMGTYFWFSRLGF